MTWQYVTLGVNFFDVDGDQREKASKEEKGTEQGGKDHGRKSSSQRDP